MKTSGYRNVIRQVEEEAGNLYSIITDPEFAIGQRAFLIRTPGGTCSGTVSHTLTKKLLVQFEIWAA